MGKKVAGWTPPETDVIVESNGNGWTPPPTDEVIEEQPKKKDDTTSVGGSVSLVPGSQPMLPSKPPTENEQATSSQRVRNPLVTIKRKGEEVLLYQIPASLVSGAAAGLGAVESTFQYPVERIRKTGQLPANYSEQAAKEIDQIKAKVNTAFTKLIDRSEKGTLKEEDKQFFLNFLDQANQRVAFLNKGVDPHYDNSKINQWQKALVSWSLDRSQKGAKITEDLVNRLGQIEDPLDAINWAVGAIAESGVQIPAAIATFGTSAIGQEIGSIYMDSINKIAQQKGITPEQVIEQGLDSPAAALAYGSAAGVMDYFGARSVVQGVGKSELTKGLRQRTLAYLKEFGSGAVPESGTELSQTVLEQIGSGLSTGDTSLNYEELAEAAARAAVGGGAIRTVSAAISSKPTTGKIIADQVKSINPNDSESIKQAAQTVKQTIDQNATPLREDTGSVPQQGGQPEGSQAQGGDDIQQPAPETSQPAPAGQPAQEQIQPQAEGQGLQVAREETGPDSGRMTFGQPAQQEQTEQFQVGITAATAKIPEIAAMMEQGRQFEAAGDMQQRNAVFHRILDIGEQIINESLKDVSGAKITLERTIGDFFGYSEPTFNGTLEVPQSSRNAAFTAIVNAADRMKQDAVHISQIRSALSENERFGVEDAEGTVFEPNVDIIFENKITKKQFRELKQLLEDEVELPGFTLHPNGRGINLYNISKFTHHEQFTEQIGRVYEGLQSRGIQFRAEESVRSLRNYGDPQAGATRTYEQVRGEVRTEGQEITPPSPPTGTTTSPPTSQPGARQTALGARFEASDEPSPIKERVKGRDMYIPRKIIQTDKEAAAILDEWNDNEFAERAIRDTSNEMPGGTRGALAANLYQRYKAAAGQATTEQEKTMWYDKAADIGVWAAQNLTKQGQETAIAGKIWKAITSDEDLLVIALEKSRRQAVTQAVKPIQKGVQEAKGQITEEIERLIRQRVTEGVEEQLKRAKLITKEQKKKISDAFDALKIQKPEGTLGATTLVPEIWNGAVEAIKRAVLAGADLANAVQAGIDYIRTHHKGDFDEADFRAKVTPAVEKLVPKPKVDPSKINEKKIVTPKLSGKKKKNFISDVVDEFNQAGEITDERFEELYAKHLGVKEFSAEDRKIIRDLAKIISDAEKFKEEVKGKLTKANIQKYRKLLERAQEANYQLQQYAQNNPATVWDTLSTILQGNLLAPISIMRNVYSNAALMPLRFMSTAIGSVVDRAITGVAKTGLLGEAYTRIVGKERTISLVGLNRGYFRGGWNGSMEGLRQIVTGQRVDERNLRDISMKFDPNRAIKRWAEKDRGLSQKINDAVEGTLGWSAEAMFRLLNLGDKPFRRAAELARAFELAELKGLKGDDALRFVLFPDAESAQEIDQAGKKATFQDESKVATMIQRTILNILSHLPGPLKVIGKSQIPFVRTPVNILAETLDYAIPPLTLLRGISQISKGNKRSGSILIGKAMTGFMVQQAGLWLLNAGLMTWGGGDDNEGKKAERRSIQYDTEPPNSLNVEAISRGLSGQGWKPKDDDIWIDYKNLGVMGILLQNQANSWYRRKKEEGKQVEDEIPEDRGLTQIFTDIGMDAIKTLSSAFDQSFLQGTSTLIKALEDPEGYEGQKWLLNTTEALTSIAIPRTITTVSTASDEYIRDTRDKDTMQALGNIFKKNLFMGDRLAARVNLWGEKITGNPEGRSRIPYYLFDVTRFKEVDTDSFKYRLYKKLKEDNFNGDWLPSMPKRTVSIKGVQIPLTNQEYEEFAIEVGQARARKLAAYMSNRPDSRLKVDDVKERYSTGYNQGRTRFMMRRGWNMWSKQKLEKLAAEREK